MTAQQRHSNEELIELIEPVCVDAGYELVDLQFTQGQKGWMLRVFIDYPEGSDKSISFTDCEAISRELSALLDVEDPIGHAYNLEVSSPGIDRPLRKAKDFKRFVGQDVKVSLRSGVNGRRNFKGRLLEVSEDESQLTVEVDGTDYQLPLADLSAAKLVPDWDALMKGASNKQKN